jgi:hypothetical protein
MTERETVTIWGAAWDNYDHELVVASTEGVRTPKQVRLPKRVSGKAGRVFGWRTQFDVDKVTYTRKDALTRLFANVKRQHDIAADHFQETGEQLAIIGKALEEES